MISSKFEHNIIYQILASIVTNFSIFFINLVLINNMSKYNFGVFTTMLSIVSLFVIVADLGVSQGTVKFISEFNSNRDLVKIKLYLKNFLTITFLKGLFFFFLFYISIPIWQSFIKDLPKNELILLLFIIIPYGFMFFLNSVSDGLQRMEYSLFFALVKEPIKLISIYLIKIFFNLDIFTVVCIFVGSFYITSIIQFLIYKGFLKKIKIQVFLGLDKETIYDRNRIKYFLYLYVHFFFIWIYPMIINIMIAKFHSMESLASFTVCTIINNIIWVFLLPVQDTLFPYFSSIFTNKDLFEKGKKKSSYITLLIIHLLFLWLIFLYLKGDNLITFLFGKNYVNHKHILILIFTIIFFESFKIVIDPILKGTNYARVLSIAETVKIIFIILFSPFILLKYSLIEFCVFLICVNFVTNLIKGLIIKKILHFNIIGHYLYATFLMIIFYIVLNL